MRFKSLIIITLVLFSGCELVDQVGNDISSGLSEAGLNVDLETGKVSLNTSEEETEEATPEEKTEEKEVNTLPDGWPENIPVYKDAEIKSALTQTKDGVTSQYIDFTVIEDARTVRDFYRGVLSVAGYTITDTPEQENLYGLEAEKEDYKFNLTAQSRTDKTTAVTLTLQY